MYRHSISKYYLENAQYFVVYTIITILSIILLKYFFRYFTIEINYWSKRGVPGPKPLPLIGTLLENITTSDYILQHRRQQKYGKFYGTVEFFRPVLYIADPSMIREVTIKNFFEFRNRRNVFGEECLISKSVVLMSDSDWRSTRNCLSPLFTTTKLKNMMSYIEDCTERTLSHIERNKNTEMNLNDLMSSASLSLIAKCTFSVDIDPFKDPNNEFIRKGIYLAHPSYLRIISSFIFPTSLQKALNIGFVDNDVIEYFRSILRKVSLERHKNNKSHLDFLSTLLEYQETNEEISELEENGDSNDTIEDQDEVRYNKKSSTLMDKQIKKLNEDEILAQFSVFLVVGHDTTALLLKYTLYALSMNPNVQEKLFKEVAKFQENSKNFDFYGLNSLKYLDAVINESLRMYSPITAMDRIAMSDCILGDQEIPIEKGTVIVFPYSGIHQDADYFPNPDTFQPERFLPENKHQIIPYTFIPFGVGPRNCIGMKFSLLMTKVFLAKLITRFKIQKTENTVEKPKYKINIFTLDCKPLYVSFSHRKITSN